MKLLKNICNPDRINYLEEALIEWRDLSDNQKKYIIYLKNTNKKYDNPSNSHLLFALDITDLSPIGYIKRIGGGGLCDIDMDFEKRYRDKVIDYVSNRYGHDKVAHIGTFGKMKAKSAVRRVCKTLDEPYELGSKIADLLLTPIHGKPYPIRESIELVKELHDYKEKMGTEGNILHWAEKVENLISNVSVHASGIIISNDSLIDTVPLFLDKNKEPTTQWDMNIVEDVGYIKFDFLGLQTLSKIHIAVDLIKERHDIDIDINNIPEDDKEVFSNLRAGDTVGVFQLEASSGIRDLMILIRPTCIEDLIALVSAYRPGPLGSNYLPIYLGVRALEREPEYLVPELEPILGKTSGFCLSENELIHGPSGLKKIKDLKTGDIIYDGHLNSCKIKKVWKSGIKEVVEYITDKNTKLICTRDHRIASITGYKIIGESDFCISRQYKKKSFKPKSFYLEKIISRNSKGLQPVWDLEIDSPHHNFIAGTNDGIIVHNCLYQEQVLEIVKNLAGYTLADADLLRRAIGKKKEEEMIKHKDKFINGWIAHGLSKDKGKLMWEDIKLFSSYGFNRCIDGDTKLYRSTTLKGKHYTIAELYKLKNQTKNKFIKNAYGYCYSLNKDNKLIRNRIKNIIYQGKKPTYKLTTEFGASINVTYNHKFPTSRGKLELKNIIINSDSIYVNQEQKLHDPIHEVRIHKYSLDTRLEKVISIDLIGEKEVYDIEMEAPYHTFTTYSGIVTSNSHAAAYAFITYQTSYLKTHYPTDYMCAIMIAESGNQDDIIKYIAECKRLDIKILPPSINKSKETFVVNKEKEIRFGIGPIKGIGSSAATIIEDISKNGYFKSLRNFYERMNGVINKSKLEALISAGTFDEFDGTRATKLATVEKIWEYKKKLKSYQSKIDTFKNKTKAYEERLIAIENKELSEKGNKLNVLKLPIKPIIPEWPTVLDRDELHHLEIFQAEHSLLGFFVTGHPLDKLDTKSLVDSMNTIDDIKKMENDSPVIIAAVITQKKGITTRKKAKMAFARIEDITGTMEVVIFPKQFATCSHLLIEGAPLKIKGYSSVTEADGGDRMTKIIVNDIELLDNNTIIHPENLNINIPLSKTKKLAALLKKYTGNLHLINISLDLADGTKLKYPVFKIGNYKGAFERELMVIKNE